MTGSLVAANGWERDACPFGESSLFPALAQPLRTDAPGQFPGDLLGRMELGQRNTGGTSEPT